MFLNVRIFCAARGLRLLRSLADHKKRWSASREEVVATQLLLCCGSGRFRTFNRTAVDCNQPRYAKDYSTGTSASAPKGTRLGIAAAVGETIANLLDPWPLKIVLDNVLRSKPVTNGWLNRLIFALTGGDKLATLEFAAIAVVVIAIIGALCGYAQKLLTTSVGQWVMHDLRQALYVHIQRMSLAYHDHKSTGDLISRVTSDIDAIQSFISSSLLDAVIDVLTLTGMVGVMFYINWQFTLIALATVPVLGVVVYKYTRDIKKASREVRKKEGEIVSVIQEVLTSIRVVKAFAREDYEQRRLEEESLENVEIALRARGMKARLSPIVGVIVAIGTGLVLWFGARLVLVGSLSAGSLIMFIWYLGKMYKPIQDLSKMTDAYSKASVGYERIREILDTDGEVKDLPGARNATRLKGAIEFDKVTFGYDATLHVAERELCDPTRPVGGYRRSYRRG